MRDPTNSESELIKKPGRAHTPAPGCLDAVSEHSVCSNDRNATSVTDIDLRHNSRDDRVIPRPQGVNGVQAPVLSDRTTTPRLAL